MTEFDETLPSTFTTATARAHGVHPRDLYAWRDAGQTVELSRGVFRHAEAPPASFPDALAVAYRSPRAIVCCVSAAATHDLTDEMPQAVQIAVPKPSHMPVIDHPPVTVFRFVESTFELGLSSFEAALGEQVRIYDAARTVVDPMRFRRRFGEPIAHGPCTGTWPCRAHDPHCFSSMRRPSARSARCGPPSMWQSPDDPTLPGLTSGSVASVPTPLAAWGPIAALTLRDIRLSCCRQLTSSNNGSR